MPLLAACCLAAGLGAPPLALGVSSPQVTRIEANNGPAAGGATVTIRGVGFGGAYPVRAVSFGGRPSPHFTVVSESELTAVSPAGEGEAEVRVTNARGEASPAVPADDYAYDPAPDGPWLGLDGNSSQGLGPVDTFVEQRVVYDRSGPVEWGAGETLAQGGSGLAASIDAGMIPVITIEFRGYSECSWESDCLPTSEGAIGEYVSGFVASASEILDKYPAAGVLFEAINEPWGYGTAAQYAAILAKLLPAAARAGLPPAQIYAGATGEGWVQGIYGAQPRLQREVKGWYLHPYARTSVPGIGALPAVQAEMTSGQGNLIVSEIGFCAAGVNHSGGSCPGSSAPARTGAEAAAELGGELRAALPDHRAGWLRALLVYSRNDGGWAMQLPGGQLTRSGEALEGFADAYG